jgi:hypothetical protein
MELAISFEAEALGVVVMEQKMARTTTTARNSENLFRISGLQFIFINGLGKKSPLSIVLIGLAQIKVYLLWKNPKLL